MSFSQVIQSIKDFLVDHKDVIAVVGKSVGLIFALTGARFVGIKLLRKIRKHPPGPVGIPFLGCLLQFGGNPKKFLTDIALNYGPVVSASLIQQQNVFLSDPYLVKKLFKQKAFANHWSNHNRFRPEPGFDAINGAEWKERRQYVSTTLFLILKSDFVLKQMQRSIGEFIDYSRQSQSESQSESQANAIAKGVTLNGRECIAFCAFNNIFSAVFGVRLTIKDIEFINAYINATQDKFNALGIVMLLDFCLPTKVPEFLTWRIISPLRKNEKALDDILFEWMRKNGYRLDVENNVITYDENSKHTEYVEHMHDNGFMKDFLEKLKEGKVTAKQIMADVSMLLTAAIDTTSHTSEMGFSLLAKNPDIQDIVYEEIKQVLMAAQKTNNSDNNSDDNISGLEFRLDVLKDLHLFRALVHEILRIACVAGGGVPHKIYEDVKIEHDGKEYILPKGALIHYNTFFMLKKKRWDTNTIMPNTSENNEIHLDYWLDKTNGDNKNRFKMNDNFLLFGTGLRDCVGQSMAKKALYSLFGELILKYKFVVPNHESVDLTQTWNLVQRLKHSINVTLVPRN